MAEIHDVTAQLHDLNPEDRVFRRGNSHVKVKVRRDLAASRLGQEVLRVSGAHADAKGKAKRRAGGVIEIVPLAVTVLADGSMSPAQLAAAVDSARRTVVEHTLAAATLARGLDALEGVGVIEAPSVPSISVPAAQPAPLSLPAPDPSPE